MWVRSEGFCLNVVGFVDTAHVYPRGNLPTEKYTSHLCDTMRCRGVVWAVDSAILWQRVTHSKHAFVKRSDLVKLNSSITTVLTCTTLSDNVPPFFRAMHLQEFILSVEECCLKLRSTADHTVM